MASTTKSAMTKKKPKDSLSNWEAFANRMTDKLGKFYVWEILAFVIPFLLLGFGFAQQKIHPFGDQQFLVTDLWHQYYPFFQLLQEKLTHGGSLLYSWRSGLGTNFLSMMSYYCASPLNLLSFFMPKDGLREGLMIILMLKFAFAGYFMAGMLRYVFHRNDISITMFGVMYALCSYMMGYYWNVIWIDTVALLPLVIQGLWALVREGKYRTYVISLGLSMIASYYIGYMICIFIVIAFFLICLYENVGFKKFFKRFGLVTGASVLGGGLSAWILLPAFYALQLTHSVNNSFPKSVTFYEAWRDVIARMLAYTEPTAKEGMPNLYCGMIPVLLLGVFLVAKKIRIREKISGVLLMAFLIVSCNMNMLNYIWHAFHFPNMLPYRFAFIFSFVLLVAGYRAFTILLEEKLHIVHWISMIVVGGIFCWLGYTSSIQPEDNHKFVWASAIISGVYLLIILLRRFAPKQIIQFVLGLAMIYEMGNAALIGVRSVGSSSYTSYPSYNDDIQEMKKQVEKIGNEPFYRTELTSWYTLNDPSLYYYNGVSQFSSMANESVTTFSRKIGIPASEAGNRYYYANTSPFTNILYDVQYVMAKDGYNADTYTMHQVAASGVSTMYKNDYTLGFGFMTRSGTEGLYLDETSNAFEIQNAMFKRMTGLSGDLFTPVDITNVGHTGFDVTRLGYGKYSFTRQDGATGDTYFKYNYTVPKEGMVYATMKVTDGESLDVYFEGAKVHRYNIGRQPYITPVGYHQPGDVVTLRCDMNENGNTGSIDVFFYQLNTELFEKGYALLKEHTFTIKSFDDTRVTGEVTAAEDGCLYLSVPYDAGWTIYVDGVKTEVVPLFEAMTGVRLTAGTHKIEMRYSPKGFVPGLLITVFCILLFVALLLLERLKKKAADADETEEETADEPEEKKSVKKEKNAKKKSSKKADAAEKIESDKEADTDSEEEPSEAAVTAEDSARNEETEPTEEEPADEQA